MNPTGIERRPGAEKLKEAEALERILSERAKEQQGTRTDIPKNSGESFDKRVASAIRKIREDESLSDAIKALMLNGIERQVGREVHRETMKEERCVYIAKAGNRIKIGFSIDPENRIESLKVGDPDIRLLAVYDGSVKLEKKLHKILSHASLGHEWYEYSNELLLNIFNCIKSHDRHAKETTVKTSEAIGTSHDTLHKVKTIAQEKPELLKEIDSGKRSRLPNKTEQNRTTFITI